MLSYWTRRLLAPSTRRRGIGRIDLAARACRPVFNPELLMVNILLDLISRPSLHRCLTPIVLLHLPAIIYQPYMLGRQLIDFLSPYDGLTALSPSLCRWCPSVRSSRFSFCQELCDRVVKEKGVYGFEKSAHKESRTWWIQPCKS